MRTNALMSAVRVVSRQTARHELCNNDRKKTLGVIFLDVGPSGGTKAGGEGKIRAFQSR